MSDVADMEQLEQFWCGCGYGCLFVCDVLLNWREAASLGSGIFIGKN